MLKYITIIFFAAVAAWAVIDYGRATDRIGEQGQVLRDLEASHQPRISKFVDAWRRAYPEPSADDLVDLRVQAERMKADLTVADEDTASIASAIAARQQRRDQAKAEVEAIPWWQWALVGVSLASVLYAFRYFNQRALG